jgi:hypothetical protein
MSSTTSYRLSGVALLIGTALSIVYNISQAFLNNNDLAAITSPLSLWCFVIGFIGSVFVLLGLPGVYTRQAGRAGILGLLGFLFIWYVILFQGVVIPFTSVTIISQITAHIVPPSAGVPMATISPPAWMPFFLASLVGQLLGVLLLAIATLRARVFPRWIAWLLIATLVVGVVSFIPFFPQALSNLVPIIVSVAIAGFGYALLSPGHRESREAVPTSAQAEVRA